MEINGELYLQVQIVIELEKEGSLLQSLSKMLLFKNEKLIWQADRNWRLCVSTGEEEKKKWEGRKCHYFLILQINTLRNNMTIAHCSNEPPFLIMINNILYDNFSFALIDKVVCTDKIQWDFLNGKQKAEDFLQCWKALWASEPKAGMLMIKYCRQNTVHSWLECWINYALMCVLSHHLVLSCSLLFTLSIVTIVFLSWFFRSWEFSTNARILLSSENKTQHSAPLSLSVSCDRWLS